ncbi:MAG: hypothetical protein HUK20_02000, partial [Fibrobacter sp.]|nr:hypothetical protein [Fibrobacter sp.]
CIFSKYEAFTDETVREYMEYFSTNKVTSQTAKSLQDRVDFYRRDMKTRSDYMDLQYILGEERREAFAEGLERGQLKGRLEIAKKMLQKMKPIAEIIELTNLPEAELLEIKQSLTL